MDNKALDMAALWGELGISSGEFTILNKDTDDGQISFISDDAAFNSEGCLCSDIFTLKENGKIYLDKICAKPFIVDGQWKFYGYEAFFGAKLKKIDKTKAKTILAAFGENVKPKFAQKHAQEIEAMRKKLFVPAPPEEDWLSSFEFVD